MSDKNMLQALLTFQWVQYSHPIKIAPLFLVSFSHYFCSDLPLVAANDSTPARGIVRFNEVEWIEGQLQGITDSNSLLWKCADFQDVLELKATDIWQITNGLDQSIAADDSVSLVQVTLVNGDVVSGELIGNSASGLKILSKSLRSINIANDQWVQYVPISQSDRIGATATTRDLASQFPSSHATPGWEQRPDGFHSTLHAATLRSDFGLPDRFRVDLRIAWNEKPSFDIAIGIDPNAPSSSTAIHLEVWDGMLVLARQQGGKADASSVKNLTQDEPMVELSIFHDWLSGVTVARDLQGKELARIALPGSLSRRCSGIQIVNHCDDLRVASLRSSPWPKEDEVKPIVNSVAPAINKEKADLNASDTTVTMTTVDGCRLSGKLGGSINGKASFDAFAIAEPVLIEFESIYRIDGNYRDKQKAVTKNEPFVLSTNRIRLNVELSTFERSSQGQFFGIQTPHLFQPALLSVNASGKMFRPSKALDELQAKLTRVPTQGSASITSAAPVPLKPVDYRIPSAMKLRTGETLQVQVSNIDSDGVYFSSMSTDSTFLSAKDVTSIFLHARTYAIPLDLEKMQRLATIPRNQSQDAPKNILVTTSGDYLRGTLVRLTDTKVEYTMKEDTLTIPRQLVSAIVWLSDRSWDTESTTNSQSSTITPSNEVQINYFSEPTTLDGMTRLSIDFVDPVTLIGRNEIVERLQLPVRSIACFTFGNQESLESFGASNPWQLRMAKLPSIFEQANGSESSSRNVGDSSPLVGKQSPSFLLKKLDGQSLKLDQLRGKVVVLDFWASWCGPCMESMSKVVDVTKSFGESRCQWLGINLQEAKGQAEEAAHRLKIDETILLDSDGDVALLYQASSIPMIVIIDPKGIVHRVFIGMEEARLDQVRIAIEECLKQ